ncbi:MAG: hypothetical protein IPJ74_01440 [Saprospiraceae bacterium]|nr:hypothetical protein [Saprospiraceae bacterium]
MNTLITLSINDFRSTFRDPIFKILLFFPFISFAIVRWGFPAIAARFPAIIPYNQVILMWACMQSATMFGMIYAFLFLEEKEEDVWQVIRILPISGIQLIFSRLLIGLIISTLVNFTLIHWGNIIHLLWYEELLLSIQFSLGAPLIALFLGAFANNRIEGLAQMKMVNVLLMIPGLIYFLPQRFLHITALIPTYWSFRSMEMAENKGNFWLFFIVGTFFYLFGILLLNRRMENKIRA